MLVTLSPCWTCSEVPEGKHLQCWEVHGILSVCDEDNLNPSKMSMNLLCFTGKFQVLMLPQWYESHLAFAQAGSLTPVITSTILHFQNFWHLPSIYRKPSVWGLQCLSDLWTCTLVILTEVDGLELLCSWTLQAWCMEKVCKLVPSFSTGFKFGFLRTPLTDTVWFWLFCCDGMNTNTFTWIASTWVGTNLSMYVPGSAWCSDMNVYLWEKLQLL